MQKSSLYALIAAVLLLGAFAANRASGRLPDVKLKSVEILAMPKKVGGWTCFNELPEEDLEHRAVPSALFHRWYFRDANKNEVELLLETATEADGYHDPMVCMTSQNWQILSKTSTRVEPRPETGLTGRPATIIAMQLRDRDLKQLLLHWRTRDLQLDKWHQFIKHDMSGQAPSCLFVRLSVNAANGYDQAAAIARRFATDVFPAIAALEQPTR